MNHKTKDALWWNYLLKRSHQSRIRPPNPRTAPFPQAASDSPCFDGPSVGLSSRVCWGGLCRWQLISASPTALCYRNWGISGGVLWHYHVRNLARDMFLNPHSSKHQLHDVVKDIHLCTATERPFPQLYLLILAIGRARSWFMVQGGLERWAPRSLLILWPLDKRLEQKYSSWGGWVHSGGGGNPQATFGDVSG